MIKFICLIFERFFTVNSALRKNILGTFGIQYCEGESEGGGESETPSV